MNNNSNNKIFEDNSKLHHCKDTSKQINHLNNLSQKLQRINPLDSLQLSKKAYNIALKKDYKREEAISLLTMGKNNWILGNFQIAVDNLLESLEISKDLNIINCEIEAITALGNVNFTQENYNKALEYYIEALKLSKSTNYQHKQADILNNIGEIHKELRDYSTALDYYLKSKELYEKINEESSLSTALLNIGHTYCLLGQYDIAKEYIYSSIHICKDNNDKIGLCEGLHIMAKFYIGLNNKNECLKYLHEALKISENIGDKISQIRILIDLCNFNLYINRNEEALNYIKRAFKLSEGTKSNALISKTASLMAKIYEKNKSYRKALCFYKKYYEAEKILHENGLEEKLENLTAQYKIEKFNQEKEIYRLRNIDLKEKTGKLEKSYQNIKIISDIGQSITSTLDLEKVFTRVYNSINMLMDANTLAIGMYNDESKEIEFRLYIDDGEKKPLYCTSIDNDHSLAVWSINNKREIIINDFKEEYKQYVKEVKIIGTNAQSIIYCPLTIENTVLGIITVQSKKKNAYTLLDLNTIKALASYISIAIKNAQESNKLAEEIIIRKNAQAKLEKSNEKLLKLSVIDSLTGISNRRHFEAYLRLQWRKCKIKLLPMSIIIIDIDHFKEYNDQYGHLAGDEIIAKVAKILDGSLKRPDYFLARYGGDEFIAILPDTNGESALAIAEEMKIKVENLNILHKYSETKECVTITVGVSSLIPNNKLTAKYLILNADKALYSAKNQGRNRVTLFE